MRRHLYYYQKVIIKDNYSNELDSFRQIAYHSETILQEICEREIKLTGISSLKISYNNVFGYYLEVRNKYKDQVPIPKLDT